MEEARRPGTGETTPHRDGQGPGRRSRPEGGRNGSRNGGRRTEHRRSKPHGLTGALESSQGQQKVDYRTWDEAAETASPRGDEGDK